MLKLEYKNKEYYAKTFACFVDYFPELEIYKNVVYNHRLHYTGVDFSIKRIDILPRLKEVKDDKRIRTRA